MSEPTATELIARADRLMVDAQNLRELADRLDELSVGIRQVGFLRLVREPRENK